MRFCIRTIEHDPKLCTEGGLLRGDGLALTGSAQALADRIREDAKRDAQQLLARARSKANTIMATAEQVALARAAGLLQALEQQHAAFLHDAQDLLIDLSQAAFDRLVAETTDRERIASCVKRVLHEVPANVANAVLRVHPDDLQHVPAIDWDIKTDTGMARGVCRLEASSGEWHADFTASVAALKGALAGFRREPCPLPRGDGKGAKFPTPP